MEKNLQEWTQKTKAIWTGVLLYAIGGIVYGIISGINAGVSTVSDVMSYASGGTGGGFGFGDFLEYLVLAAIIIGYVMYILGLGNFATILGAKDAGSINKVRVSAIIIVVSYLWTLIGFWGWVASILNIVAFVYALLGYIELKNSGTFPAKGRKGASNLFLSMLLGVIASVIAIVFGWIPILGVIGGIIAGILQIIAFVLIFVGWSQIKSADPQVML